MGMFGAKPAGYYANQAAPSLPLNLGQAQDMATQPPQTVMGTHPIAGPSAYGTPGIGDGVPGGNLPTDPRIAKALQPGMFGKGGRGWQILGIIGDALQTAGGGKATYQEAQQKWAEMEQERQKLSTEQQYKLAELATKLHTPQIVNAGNGRVISVDPATNATTEISPLTPAPDQGAIYASHFGQEGSPEWVKAYQDFHLRGNSPDVLAARQANATGLIDYRNAHRPPSASGGKPSSTRVVNGQVFHKINGKWYTGD